MIRRSLTGAALAATLALTGCADPDDPSPAGDAAGAVTVSSCGRQLSFGKAPERVVTLDQSSTETLLTLGLGDRMVGTSNLKTKVAPHLRAAFEKIPVLNPKLLTGEQLRAATPDLVVSPFQEHFTKDRVGTREELAALDLPSYVSAVDCPDHGAAGATPFDRLFTDFANLGRIFRVDDRATALVAEQRTTIERATARKPTGQPTVVWLYSVINGLPYVAGNGGMPSEMSRLLGVRNAFDDVDQLWPEVSWEQIARRNPDVIVIGDLSERGAPGDSAADKLALMRKDPVVSQLTAVRDNRVIEVPGIEMDPSVRTVNTLRSVSEGLAALGHVG
jgi:iron complex transport system substrate-binding protein